MLQHLENVMASFIALKILQQKRETKNNYKVNEEELKKVHDQQKRLTLGPMIERAIKQKNIPKPLEARFQTFLKERNWLVHNCVPENYLALRSRELKKKLLNRLDVFINEATDLLKEVYGQFEKWFESKGYDVQAAHNLSLEVIEKAKKG